MQVRVENTRLMSSDELLSKLHKSAVLYSQYADTTLLFIFREKRQIDMNTMKLDLEDILNIV